MRIAMVMGDSVQIGPGESDDLVAVLQNYMPLDMLNPDSIGAVIPTAEANRFARLAELLRMGDAFGVDELSEVQSLLDSLIDIPHRMVEPLFPSAGCVS